MNSVGLELGSHLVWLELAWVLVCFGFEAGCSPLSPSLALAHSLSWFALSPELTPKLSP